MPTAGGKSYLGISSWEHGLPWFPFRGIGEPTARQCPRCRLAAQGPQSGVISTPRAHTGPQETTAHFLSTDNRCPVKTTDTGRTDKV